MYKKQPDSRGDGGVDIGVEPRQRKAVVAVTVAVMDSPCWLAMSGAGVGLGQ